MADWFKVASAAALPAAGMVRVEAQGKAIVLAREREHENIYAFSAECPHAGAPLEQGALCNGHLICPWHKSVFDIKTGLTVEPPALKDLKAWPVKIEGDDVLVDFSSAVRPGDASQASERSAAKRYAIIGGGAAAAAAAATLLERGFAGELAMYTAEREDPYDRTLLSKYVPAGDIRANEVPALLPDACAHDAHLHIEHVPVARLDALTKHVTLDDGREADFDAILIASGSVPQRPLIDGAQLGHVFTLRNVNDARAIFDTLGPGDHAVMLGDSFIALETASALRKRDVHVCVITRTGVPLRGSVGARVGVLFRDWHESHGVEFRRASAVRFDGNGDVTAVELDNGATLPAQAVIVGLGVRPATNFIAGLPLDDDGGISVDDTMRAAPGVYAAGDIARVPLHGGAARVEHWRVAQQQARVAAMNMLGDDAHYDGVPYFWTLHYGQQFDFIGHATHWDDMSIHGRLGDEHFSVVYSRLGHVQAVLACGYERETAALIERMRASVDTDVACSTLGV